MPAPELILYTRPGCHLCAEMKAVIEEVSASCPVRLREVNVDSDPTLRAQYGTEVPVLFVNGRKAFKYRTSTTDLRRRLAPPT